MKGVKIKKGTNDKVSLEFTSKLGKTSLEYDGNSLLLDGEEIGGSQVPTVVGATVEFDTTTVKKFVVDGGIVTDILENVIGSKFNQPVAIIVNSTPIKDSFDTVKTFSVSFDISNSFSTFLGNGNFITCRGLGSTGYTDVFRLNTYSSGNLTISAGFEGTHVLSYSFTPTGSSLNIVNIKFTYSSATKIASFYKDGGLVATSLPLDIDTLTEAELSRWSIGKDVNMAEDGYESFSSGIDGIVDNIVITVDGAISTEIESSYGFAQNYGKYGTGSITQVATNKWESILS